jgi:uncharacterized membrane protein YeaQ/YmgE (transglycosylase-associated protein family)
LSLIAYIIVLAITGLFVGALARLALPGPDPLTLLQTMLVGIAGSLLAGILVRVLFDESGAGILLSVLVTTGIVYAIRRSRGGTLTRPADARRLGGDPRRRGL